MAPFKCLISDGHVHSFASYLVCFTYWKFIGGFLWWSLTCLVSQAFESPHTHSSCVTFLRQYAEESFSKEACLVVPKSIISYPQVMFDFCIRIGDMSSWEDKSFLFRGIRCTYREKDAHIERNFLTELLARSVRRLTIGV